MKVSSEQLLQIIGQLYVENQMLNRQVELQTSAIQQHMADDHKDPTPEEEPGPEGEGS